jgi:putative transposase
MKLSRRSVQQIWKYFKETGKEPILGQNIGCPSKLDVKLEAEIVKKANMRYKFRAQMLERVIRKQYRVCISYNRIHMDIKTEDLAHEETEEKATQIDLISRSALFWMAHPEKFLLVAISQH